MCVYTLRPPATSPWLNILFDRHDAFYWLTAAATENFLMTVDTSVKLVSQSEYASNGGRVS